MDNQGLAVCVVGNFKYLRRYFNTFYNELTKKGNYRGTVIVLTSYFTPTFLIRHTYRKNVTILRNKDITFNKDTRKKLNSITNENQPNRNLTKKYQWNKLHLFDEKMKRWKYIFYIDVNMHFHGDISEILNNPPEKELLARADSYPSYDKKLVSQFDTTQEKFPQLSRKYDLEINNYFQTGILFFDTSIINSSTKHDLIELTTEFPLSITNEQGIMNLYFLFDKNLYSELPIKISGKTTYFYWMVEGEEILITKQLRFQYK